MILDSLLLDIERSALGEAVRGLGIWSYALINLAHILSVAILFGAILILDLRLLGWRRHTNLNDIAEITLLIAKLGFAGAMISGICMLSVNASEYSGNPFLIIKFGALFFALINALLIRHVPAWKTSAVHGRSTNENILAVFGLVSLTCWLIVVSAGRMIAYW